MKKIYLFMTAVLISATQAFAAVSVNDVIGKFSGTLTIDEAEQTSEIAILPGSENGTITLVLPDFTFAGIKLGDIVVTNAEMSSTGILSGITSYRLYLTAMEGSVFITLKNRACKLEANTAKLDLSIDVPGLDDPVHVTFANSTRVAGTVIEKLQMPNAGFENNWHEVGKGVEPDNWHSFNSGAGQLISYAKNNSQLTESNDVRPGSTGSKSAKLQSKFTKVLVVEAKANGNLTNGQINAASTTPDAPNDNYNFSDPSNSGFNTPFATQPDSMVFWAKYIPADGNVNSNVNQARMHAVITTNAYYKDPEGDGDYANVKVAEAEINYKAASDKGWQRISVPFVYSNKVDAANAAYILINFTTNKTPGEGSTTSSAVDELYLDDVEMIYNAADLKSFTLDGEAIKFTNYEASTNKEYCDSCYEYVASIPEGRSVDAGFVGFNAANHELLVYVIGTDFSTSKAYKLYKLTMKENDTTAIDITKAEIKAKKLVMNGQVFIIRDNVWYNVLGTRVR